MKKIKLIIFYSMLMAAVSFSKASAQQVFKTTPTSVIAYYEYLPSGYNSNSDKYPIVIFLHGIGERGPNTTDKTTLEASIARVAKLGPPLHVKNGANFPFILISPQLKNNFGTWSSGYVMEVINHVKTYLRIDERRIYITGLSLGGGGTWVTAQDYPKLFAAVAPVCGGYNSTSKAINLAKESLPVWAFHGDKDTTVPLSRTVNMVNAVNGCTPKPSPLAKLTIYAGIAHNAWNYAYRTDHSMHNPNVYDWMLSFTNTATAGNKIPIAKAGADLTRSIATGTTVSVYGSATDSDGTVTSYVWKKLSGPGGTLSGTATKTLKITSLKKGTYVFQLQVKDNAGNTDSDYVKLIVKD